MKGLGDVPYPDPKYTPLSFPISSQTRLSRASHRVGPKALDSCWCCGALYLAGYRSRGVIELVLMSLWCRGGGPLPQVWGLSTITHVNPQKVMSTPKK